MSKSRQPHETETDKTNSPEEWGDTTKQAAEGFPHDLTHHQSERHTDAAEIRRCFGLSRFNPLEYDFPSYPDIMIHEGPHEDRGTDQVGGTNFLAIGGLGSGKSTQGLVFAKNIMEINQEAVVWRGSPKRSEWLPFKPWTRLFLPANCRVTAEWQPEDKTAEWTTRPANLANEVREVIYYDEPREVTENLQPGTFNVVYPDPSFSGCDRVLNESENFEGTTEHVPQWAAEEEEEPTPTVHWWYAWAISRVFEGPYQWTTLVFDETADFAPESVSAGPNDTYQKVDALRSVIADSRKFNFSLFFYAHNEVDLHYKLRLPIQWRIDMGKKTPNRISGEDEVPQGFRNIPMSYDMLQGKGVGHAVVWDELHFNRITWDDVADWPEDEQRELKITFSQ